MKKVMILAAGLLALAACTQKEEPVRETFDVRISPVLTKVAETTFENGDAIGVNISRGATPYATNAKLTYNGTEFSGNLQWYAEGTDQATVTAYYPYSETLPTSFSVQADQSAGTSASDFVAGIKEGVIPSAYAVTVPFRHKLTRIILNVTNNAEGEPTAIKLKGGKLTVNVASDFSVSVDETSAAGTVTAFKKSATQYVLIVPPQTVSFIATVITAGGNELTQLLQEATLAPGKQYSISMIVNPADLKIAFTGEIEDWEDGGELGSDDTLVEKLSEGYILYHEDKYTVALMKDGKYWMTQNMRYVPEGIEVSDDLTKVTAGVFYPLVLKEDLSAAEFSRDITVINSRGYLYQAEVALGLKVGDLTTVAAAQALEGAQGLCPKGWHVPTTADILDLVGKGSQLTTNPNAPYYNGADGSIALLNADGFNMEAYGAVTIQDNTKTSGTFMGRMANYDHLTSGMFCGSSYGSVTYNTAGDETSGIKNLQFYGLMPMTNKTSEDQYTCNGTKVSYRIAAPLRCVRND
jgi:uncharacterized protein (TIGR02145 family)